MSNPNRSSWWRSPQEVERLKSSADLVGMVRGHGVVLSPEGADLVGLCPFHPEKTPSFRVTPAKNLWHCFGCGKGGSAVDWLVATRGVSIREAFESLRISSGSVESQMGPARDWTECRFEADPTWSDGRILSAVADHYAERLKVSPVAQEYLAKRGLWEPALVERFRLGYADRTLGPALGRDASSNRLRERLMSLGVLRESTGHEHLNGSLVVPVVGEPDGMGLCEVVEMYGRKVGSRLRVGTPLHLYLKGEHRGVFNAAGIRSCGSGTVVLCEALLDALTLIRWGIEPVTSAYGVHGVTKELWAFLTTSGFHRIVLAFDGDEAGDRAASDLAPRLASEGLEVQRMRIPQGQDINAFALASNDPAGSLRQALADASWMSERLYEEDLSWLGTATTEIDADPKPSLSLAAQAPAVAAAAADPLPIPPSAPFPEVPPVAESDISSAPVAPPDSIEGDSGTFDATFGDRSWRVKGLLRNRTDDVLRVTLRVSRQGIPAFHLDTLDLYQAKSREAFARTAGAELGIDLEVCRADLARLVVALESRQQALFAATREPPPTPVRTLTPAERDEALALLRRPDMLRQLLSDLEESGMVGEEENKLLSWLSLTSRRLESPLGLLIQSTSAAGKSSLLDGVLRTMPEEDVVRYSAMSGQALFYMGGVSLRHKILAVAEEEGARRASYSLKLLQSDGELSMASTTKDPESGQLVTKEYRTEGPVALALTTTSLSVDPELQNRCLVLCVDESREQTEAIHHRQRLGRTRQGQVDRRKVSERLSVWRNAQRLLQPLDVVNPYAEALTFASHRTRTRRDMAKYLTLVEAVALAHQHQKTRHRDEHGEYIEVDLDDIELANRLAVRGLGMGLRELSGPTDRLLRTLRTWVRTQAQKQGIEPSLVRFTRRDLSDCTPWSATQLKEHLRTLVESEALTVVRGKSGLVGAVQYQLESWDEEDPRTAAVGLLDLSELRSLHPDASYRGTWASGDGRPEGGRGSAGCTTRPTLVVLDEVPEVARNGDLRAPRLSGKVGIHRSAGSAGRTHRGTNGTRSVVVADLVVTGPDEAAA